MGRKRPRPGFLDEGLIDEEFAMKQHAHEKTHPHVNPRQRDDYEYMEASEEWMEIVTRLWQDDQWDERLLSAEIFGNLEQLLGPREFFVLEEMVRIGNDSTCDRDIEEGKLVALLRRSSPKARFTLDGLYKVKYSIKVKIARHNEDQLPGWVRNKIWEGERYENNS